jgi:predicted ester cyclase
MLRMRLLATALVCLTALLNGCHKKELAELKALKAAMETEQKNLTAFDDLDFNVFNEKRWDLLGKSHARTVAVYWPDGRVTRGLDAHTEELKAMFDWAPDLRVSEHPVKLADRDWTAVTGTVEGTFTQPMLLPDGRNIPPTGKQFKISIATFGHWKDGVMDEEHLFFDNAALFAQIGVDTTEGTWDDPFPDAK